MKLSIVLLAIFGIFWHLTEGAGATEKVAATLEVSGSVMLTLLWYHFTNYTRIARYVSGLAYFWCCQVKSDNFIGMFDIFWQDRTQNVLTCDHQWCCLQWLEKTNLTKIEKIVSRQYFLDVQQEVIMCQFGAVR